MSAGRRTRRLHAYGSGVTTFSRVRFQYWKRSQKRDFYHRGTEDQRRCRRQLLSPHRSLCLCGNSVFLRYVLATTHHASSITHNVLAFRLVRGVVVRRRGRDGRVARRGALAVDVEDALAGTDAEEPLFAEGDAAAQHGWRRNTMRALVAADADAAALVAQACIRAGVELPHFNVQSVADRDWV